MPIRKLTATIFFAMILSITFGQTKDEENHTDSLKSKTSADYKVVKSTDTRSADYKIIKATDEKFNFESFFTPGLGYSYFQPKASDSIGHFSGITIAYLIFAKSVQNDEPGPSHARFYAKLNMLKSSKNSISSMFMYTLGLDLSLEKNPKRSFLIPYFGLEFGGISQKQFGTTIQFTPTLGVYVLSKKNLIISLNGGYVYPVSDFEMLQGWFGQAGVNFSLW